MIHLFKIIYSIFLSQKQSQLGSSVEYHLERCQISFSSRVDRRSAFPFTAHAPRKKVYWVSMLSLTYSWHSFIFYYIINRILVRIHSIDIWMHPANELNRLIRVSWRTLSIFLNKLSTILCSVLRILIVYCLADYQGLLSIHWSHC